MKKLVLTLLLLQCPMPYGQESLEPRIKLTPAQFAEVSARCAPFADAGTLLAVATTESALYVNSISLNRPVQSARRNGLNHRRLALTRQPHSKKEALQWMRWFSDRQYMISVGLMQINTENASLFHVTAEQLFDPCTNISVGATILAESYRRNIERHQSPHQALLDAISEYNSGSSTLGYSNGYVYAVISNTP